MRLRREGEWVSHSDDLIGWRAHETANVCGAGAAEAARMLR